MAKQAELKAAGVSDVIVYAVNDGAVMQAWAKDQGTEGSMIRLLGDPHSEFTKALGLELTDPRPQSVGLLNRCKRFSMLVKDCKVKILNVAASDDDPAGDDKPEISMATQMLKDIKTVKDEL